MYEKQNLIFKYTTFGILLFILLYFLSLRNYLLYHTLAEFFCIIISILIFYTTCISRKYNKNSYLLFLGTAYLFVGLIDLVHTLSFKGMNIFEIDGANLPTQLWILGRYFEVMSFTIAILISDRKININAASLIYGIILTLCVLSIYTGEFPVCFNENYGLTKFKIISEYFIVFMLILNIMLLVYSKQEFPKQVKNLIIASLSITIISELCFTLYKIDVYGFMNFIGHYFKIISYYCLFSALLKTGIKDPFDLLIKQFNYEKQLTEKYFEFAKVVLIVIDFNGKIVSINKKGCDLLGYCKEELTGADWFDKCLLPIDREHYRKNFKELIEVNRKAAQEKAENIYENQVLTKAGNTLIIEWNNTLIYDMEKNLSGILYSGKDITSQRTAEKKLNEQVFSCNMLSAELRERNTELEELNKFKDEFLSIITHELRAPVTVINGAAEFMSYHCENENNQKSQKFINMILKNTERINKMIDNILNLKKIESGSLQLKLKQHNISRIFKDTINNYSIVLAQKNIKLNLVLPEEQVEIFFDKEWIAEVILNFIHNAAKFTPENGEITAGIKTTDTEIICYIKDTGEGIDKKYLECIFEKYNQEPNQNLKNKITGSGLGLTICKKIIEMHNGRIWAESEKNKGATFYFALPSVRK